MSLETIITHYRNRLASLPDAILIGEIPEGAENIPPEVLQLIAPAHCAFLKLCNDSNYQEFMDSYFQKQKEYFDEDPEDIDNIRYYNASKELKQVLDNTKPIYNV